MLQSQIPIDYDDENYEYDDDNCDAYDDDTDQKPDKAVVRFFVTLWSFSLNLGTKSIGNNFLPLENETLFK